MLVAGIDIGSTTTKAVLLFDGKPVATAIGLTGTDCNQAAEQVLNTTLTNIKRKREDLSYIVSTGYGRNAIDFSDEAITEISANARGAFFLGNDNNGKKVKSIIDVGGQDTKAIVLDDTGKITNFTMNDKCAAGTGRFIEVIARVLQESIDDFAKLSLTSKKAVTINATCTVFAESEVISLIAKKVSKPDIIAGLHKSIAKRIADLGKVAGIRPLVFFDGGGAKNIALKQAIEKELGYEIYVPANPQHVVALGAALIAHEKATKKQKTA